MPTKDCKVRTTLGAVWIRVRERAHSLMVVESNLKLGPYGFIREVSDTLLEVSHRGHESDGSWVPEFSFDLSAEVAVMDDHVEFTYEDEFGDSQEISLYFLFQPSARPIPMDFIEGVSP
jgi:hypothetical protein